MSNTELRLRVKAERKKRRWTQEYVAQKAKMSLRAYQMFETGNSVPQPDNLRAILAAVELDPDGSDTQTDDGRCSTCERPLWPRDVQVFLDTMGAYVTSLDESDQVRTISDVVRQIFMRRT